MRRRLVTLMTLLILVALPATAAFAVTRTGGPGNNTLKGTARADKLYGRGGNDRLIGKGGNDLLSGDNGNDTLNGGPGPDHMLGGPGSDIFIVDNARDFVSETAARSGGTDLVESAVSFRLPDHVESLTLTGGKAIAGTGNGLANHLTGNAAANHLTGGGGTDMLDGAGGADVLSGGAGGDSFRFDTKFARAGTDTVTDFVPDEDRILVSHHFFAALAKGHLPKAAFSDDGIAHTSAEHILYDPDNGALVYDANGNARGGAHHFAALDPGLALTSADFLVVA